MSLTIGDLIEVRPFPAVVQSADVRQLRVTPAARAAAEVDAFVGGYCGFDDRSRHALQATLHALAGAAGGAAFFLNGVFGSGKSHLLGLLALLCDGRGHGAFAAANADFAHIPPHLSKRLVVHFSLDDYDPARFSLEEVFWREVRAEWARRQLPRTALELPPVGSRGESFAVLEAALAAQSLDGLVVCIDELSLFLSARPAAARHSALQGDALFLQFLGQRAARTRLWVFAALQKTVDDIGEIEAYSLSQIRDRFVTLPLGLAHLPSLIERRLLVQRDPAALYEHCRAGFETLSTALPLLDFGLREWAQLYPFHPATVTLLEQVVARFFSRTRSAVQFCVRAIDPIAPATLAILPGAVFEYFEPELAGHPDLRPLAEVWQSWQAALPELAPEERDRAMLHRLMQGLLLFKIAGAAPSVRQLANAMAFDAGLGGEANYEYARVLLERLRTQSSYLVVERAADDTAFAERYAIDFGTRVAEMARRQVRSVLQALAPADGRIARYVTACAQASSLPLATLALGEPLTVMWRNSPRRCEIALYDSTLTPSALANRLAALAQPGYTADFLLCLMPPLLRESALATAPLLDAARACGEPRWRHGLVLWTPRLATHNEIEQARESTAQHLLEADPALQDNRRGRAILGHLKADSAGREAALGRLVVRLFHEGQIVTGGGVAIDAAELAGMETWTGALEAIADFVLPPLFPRFDSIAPRLRLLSTANSEALCLDILRRPRHAPYFAPAHERLVRALAEPLGLAHAHQGRWQIAPPSTEIAAAVRAVVPDDGIPWTSAEAVLAKTDWGLAPEQTALLVAAMLRFGQLTACDARGALLAPQEMALPLRRTVHTLRLGYLLAGEVWQQVSALTMLLYGDNLPALSFAAQEEARSRLTAWRDDLVAEIELARARLLQLRRRFGHSPTQWSQSSAVVEAVETIVQSLSGPGPTAAWLERVARLDLAGIARVLANWHALAAALEARQAELVEAYAFLVHPDLSVPADLAVERGALLAEFEIGEALIESSALPARVTAWRTAYNDLYRAWHTAQHNTERFAPYRRLAASDAVRALERLGRLENRPLPHAAELRAALTEVVDQGCGRDGELRTDEPVCASCRLRLGDRLKLRDPAELEAIVGAGLAALRQRIEEDDVRAALDRHDPALVAWDGAAATVLPLLSPAALVALDLTHAPRVRAPRSWRQLWSALAGCRTRRELKAAFLSWLGPDDDGDDEEITVLD